jgi:hypothetical protein
MKRSEDEEPRNFLAKNKTLRNAIIAFAVIEAIDFLIFFYVKFWR